MSEATTTAPETTTATPGPEVTAPPEATLPDTAEPAAAPGALDELPAVEGLEPSAVTYEPTGDASLDLALEFLGNLGFGPDHAALKAAGDGDFAALKSALAKLGDKAKGWERIVKIGEEAYSRSSKTKKEAADKLGAEIAAAAGGPETWAKVRAWATANATPEERAEVNAAFAAGGKVARLMAAALHKEYLAKAERDPAAATDPSGSGKAPTDEPLTARAYQAAVGKLNAKYRGDLLGAGAVEYRALQQRRLAARRAGK